MDLSNPSSYLPGLRKDFPDYDFWTETVRDDARFVARRRSADVGPHTVITGNLDELRDCLSGSMAALWRPSTLPLAPVGDLVNPRIVAERIPTWYHHHS